MMKLIAGLVVMVACASPEVAQPDGAADRQLAIEPGTHRAATLRTTGDVPLAQDCDANNFTYNGGPLIRNPRVVIVYWTHLNVGPSSTVTGTILGFYRNLLNGLYMDALAAYSANGYTIGHGSVVGAYFITPYHNGTAISANSVEAELDYQISLGYLPASDANTIYAVYFPSGVVVSLYDYTFTVDSSQPGCPGDACGFHEHYSSSAGERRYMVFPDVSNPQCACNHGAFPGELNMVTDAASHELSEVVTDPDLNAWNSGLLGICEIADHCEDNNDAVSPIVLFHEQREHAFQEATFWNNWSETCVVAPSNGRQTTDLLWRNGTSMALWEMTSPATVMAFKTITSIATNFAVVGTGDINGDGFSDLVLRNTTTGDVTLWFMHEGTLLGTANPGTATLDWTLLGAADVNGDGISDLVWRNTGNGHVAVWRMNADGSVGAYFNPGSVTSGWAFQGFGDFNHDGISDLLWRNGTATAIWLMYDSSVLQFTNPGTVALDLAFGGIGDINGDGVSDIVWRSSSTGAVTIWMVHTDAQGKAVVASSSATSDWSLKVVGDIDGDNIADLVWRNSTTPGVAVWLMNSTGSVRQFANSSSATLDWSLIGSGSFN